MDQTNIIIILSAVIAVSEAIALIPSVKSNSIFQLIYNGLKKITGRK